MHISALLCLLKILKNSMSAIAQRFFILLITYLILMGCSTVPIDSSETRVRHSQMDEGVRHSQMDEGVRHSQMDEVMQYYSGLLGLPADELVAEYHLAKERFERRGSDEYRIKYILLLILPNAEFRNLIAALRLLTEWTQEEGSNLNGLNGLRLLLVQLVTQQQHLEIISDNFYESLKIKEQRVKILQNQIDAIKTMEKNLIRRDPVETN